MPGRFSRPARRRRVGVPAGPVPLSVAIVEADELLDPIVT